MKQLLTDQFKQNWSFDVSNSSKCTNYRIFKTKFEFERYLIDLSPQNRKIFTKFRCHNHRLPVEAGVFINIPRNERKCTLCYNNDIGDEFHFIFKCNHFRQQRKDLLKGYYLHHASTFKMSSLFNSKNSQLVNLCKFIKQIMSGVNS